MRSTLEGLDEAGRSVMRAGAVAQPIATWTQPLALNNPGPRDLSNLLISCSFTSAQVRAMIADGHPWFKEMADPQWSFLELPTGHWPMFSAPEQLASLLLDLAANA